MPHADGTPPLSSAPELAIDIQALTRRYAPPWRQRKNPSVEALRGVDLAIRRGELFGLLGRNGAGKTTLIRILSTLLTPTSGSARVDGLDVVADVWELRRRIAMVSGGESSGYGILSVREQLLVFSQLHGVPLRVARRRLEELLAATGLTDLADRKINALSTGMRQKVNLCRGLIAEPRVLFLDEPTVGLDVQAAREVRAHVRRWLAAQEGRTVLLTTHILHEAEQLCDRIAIIHDGTIIVGDTSAQLKQTAGGVGAYRLQLASDGNGAETGGTADGDALVERLRTWEAVSAAPQPGGLALHLELARDALLVPLLQALGESGLEIRSLTKHEATLEDAFVRLVGLPLEAEATPAR